MTRRRIKILYTETYSHVAGGQRGLLDLVHHLDKDRFEPVVVIQSAGHLMRGLQERGIRTIIQRMEPFKNRWLPYSWAWGVPVLTRIMRKECPDVVHSNHLYVGRYSGRAARRLRIPCLVTLRLVHPPELWDRQNRWDTLKAHNHIISNSDEGRKVFETDHEIRYKIATIKNGIDLSRFRPHPNPMELRARQGGQFGITSESIVVTQIASRVPQKGNEDLLQAFAPLAQNNPRLHLVLVGGPFGSADNRSSLLRLARQAGVAERVHLTDYVWDVVDFLNLADISVLASREREGLPRCIIEAMACGKPIIATDVGGSKELVRDGITGFLVGSRAIPSLQARLSELISSHEMRIKFGAAGLAFARQDHDITHMISRYETIYERLASQKQNH